MPFQRLDDEDPDSSSYRARVRRLKSKTPKPKMKNARDMIAALQALPEYQKELPLVIYNGTQGAYVYLSAPRLDSFKHYPPPQKAFEFEEAPVGGFIEL